MLLQKIQNSENLIFLIHLNISFLVISIAQALEIIQIQPRRVAKQAKCFDN